MITILTKAIIILAILASSSFYLSKTEPNKITPYLFWGSVFLIIFSLMLIVAFW